MTARNGRTTAWCGPIAAGVALVTLSACVVHDRTYDDEDTYRYQHRQHGLYNDYEYRNSYDYDNDDYYYRDDYGNRRRD